MKFFFILSFILYFSGIINCISITNKNILNFLIASEFMFLGIDLLFIGSSLLLNHQGGIIYSFFLLLLTVGESVMGLGLCVLSLRLKNSINFVNYSNLKF